MMTRPAGTSSLRHERIIPTPVVPKKRNDEVGHPLRPLPFGYLLAQALLLLSQFGSQFGSEVFGFEHRAYFHFSSPVEGAALEPLDRLFHRPYLPQPKASDQLL